MPIDYTIEVRAGLLRTFWSGDVGDDEFIARYMEILDHQDFPRIRKELTNLSQLTSISVTVEAITTIAKATSRRLGNATLKTSVYAPSDIAFGLARVYFAYADNLGNEVVNVFRSLQEAESWIGVD